MLFTTVAAATKNLLLLLSLVISCFFFFSSLEGDVYFLLVRNLSNQNQYFLFFFFLPLPSRYTFAVTVHRLFKGDHYHHWILFLYHADTLKTKIKRDIGKKKLFSK